MELRSKSVLITGVEGFTGIHLKSRLERAGMTVFGTTKSSCSDLNKFQMDITDTGSIEKVFTQCEPDYIIHLAAISFVGHSDPSEFYRVNTVGTENLLKVISSQKSVPKKIIVASSANVYGNAGGTTRISESESPEPVNHYACSKLAMEKIVTNFFEHLDIIITRPFNYTGPGQAEHFLVPKIVSHFLSSKEVIELGNLDVSRDYSSIDFIVSAYEALLASSSKSDILNLCSGSSISLLEIIELTKSITNKDIEVKINPDFVRSNEVKCIVGDNRKLIAAVGDLKTNDIERILMKMLGK
ncbi:GDP-mannose 4,6-dehydratase [Aliiglaciecola sp.]|nr:GDP-mannose 4,6-dehydratase [Aliiglaciecola sp.]